MTDALWTYRARCARVVDGDTLELEVDLGFGARYEAAIRLLGVDAPELPTAEGQRSRAALSQLVAAGSGAWPLRVRTHRLASGGEARSFARWVGTVWVLSGDGGMTDVGAALIAMGAARPRMMAVV